MEAKEQLIASRAMKLMEDAVQFRNLFAASHVSYAVSLKWTGGLLTEYGLGQVQHLIPPSFPPPSCPPPLPSFSPAPPINSNSNSNIPSPRPPPPLPRHWPPEKKQLPRLKSAAAAAGGVGPGPSLGLGPGSNGDQSENLAQRFNKLNEDLLKASERAQEVSKMPNLADNRGKLIVRYHILLLSHCIIFSSLVASLDVEYAISKLGLGFGSDREKKEEKIVACAGPSELAQRFNKLNDDFLKAAESAQEVSKMMESTRMNLSPISPTIEVGMAL